mgnify:CR=1 FL=1
MKRSILRAHARAIFQAGLEAADPISAVRRAVHVEGKALEVAGRAFPLGGSGTIRAVGMGKASAAMALALEEMLGQDLDGGVVVVKYGHGLPLERIRVVEGGHPVPDAAGEAGAREIIHTLKGGEPEDLFLCLISGGGSALSPAPVAGVSLEDKQSVTRLLLGSGATIHETNTVRKHLSRLKGGQLARLAHPARVISLILSDVVGDDLDVIASGPTVADPSTYVEALSVFQRTGLLEKVPESVGNHLQAGVRGEIPETPKPGDPSLERVRNLIVGSNDLALRAAEEKAAGLGYRTLLPPGLKEGEARVLGKAHAALARSIRRDREPAAQPVCILTGGEATVTLRGDGKGGRSQELAVSAALELEGLEGAAFLSGGTDGTDGPTDAAGGLVDDTTVARGRGMGLDAWDYLERNDTYHYLQPLGDLLITGPTLTNVMDLRVMLLD